MLAACAAWTMGCGGADSTGSGGGGGAAPTTKHVDGAPTKGTGPDRSPIPTPSAPKALGVLGGGLALGTVEGLYTAKVGDVEFALVPTVDDDGNILELGAVSHLARRDGGGILVDAALGLFDDYDGILLKSPLDAALDHDTIDAMSSIGTDTAEELWVLSKGKAMRIADGKIEDVSVEGGGTVEATFASATGQAVLVSGETGWLVDVNAGDASDFAGGLGHVYAGDRGDDGSAYLGSDLGLVVRDRAGDVTFYSLVAAGKKPAKVVAVSSAYGAVFAATEDTLVQITADGPKIVSTEIGVVSALATDANGDVWSLEAGKVFHHATGAPVSFKKDVKPFFEKHCTTCHDHHTDGAPAYDFADYAVAVKEASKIIQHLTADAKDQPMPPADVETLTAADYAVVTRWVASGLMP